MYEQMQANLGEEEQQKVETEEVDNKDYSSNEW